MTKEMKALKNLYGRLCDDASGWNNEGENIYEDYQVLKAVLEENKALKAEIELVTQLHLMRKRQQLR